MFCDILEEIKRREETKMNLGVDIDGVLADDDTYRVDHMAKFCYEHGLPEMEQPNAYEGKCNWNEEIMEKYRREYFFEYIRNAPARAYSAEVLTKLQQKGHRIIIITGRYRTQEDSPIGKQMRQDTIAWLEKNKIPYDVIYFTHCPKVKEIKEAKIDVMIEDNPEVMKESTKITKTFCMDNRYNHDLAMPNLTRVYSWYDIYAKLVANGY